MEPLQHYPRIKQQIKEALYDFLYTPVQKKFKLQLDTLIIQNTLLGGHRHKSFSYKGILYNCDTSAFPRKANRLLPQFQNTMDLYLRDLKHLNEQELPYVLGFINQVLNASNNLSDCLRLLPESVHSPIKALIATCPCEAQRLPAETVAQLTEKNASAIQLMKSRMVINLLL